MSNIMQQIKVLITVIIMCYYFLNNRKVVGSRPTKVVCITVLTGNRLG